MPMKLRRLHRDMAMQGRQADRLRQHGLAVTTSTLQGLPVLLLAQVPGAGGVQASASPSHSGSTPKGQRLRPSFLRSANPPKCPPHRPLRS